MHNNHSAAPETIRELIKKIHRLSNDSAAPAGEKAAAEKKLADLMEKWGVTFADLESEKTSHKEYLYTTIFEFKLMKQIAYAVTGDKIRSAGMCYVDKRKSKAKDGKTRVFFELTEIENVEFRQQYMHYSIQLYDHLLDYTVAFFQKHKIFPPNDKKVDLESVEDVEQFRKYSRVLEMAKTVDGETYKKRQTALNAGR